MTTWTSILLYIHRHGLPLNVFFLADRHGQLVDLETGKVIASTVQDAERIVAMGGL